MSALHSISSPSAPMLAGRRTRPLRPRRLREINASGECPSQGVLALLEEHAQHHPLNRALVMLDGQDTRAVTYVELAQRVKRLAGWLSARFPDGGEPIGVLSASSPDWGIVALATIASRNVLVPLDVSMESDALAAALGRVAPAITFSSTACYDLARALASPAGEILCMDDAHLDATLPQTIAAASGSKVGKPAAGTALMAFTSGTTATPKAVEISFDNLLFQIRALTRCFALRPSDRLLSLLPMHHMLEFTTGFLCPLWSGAQVHYLNSLLPDEALTRIRALGITRVVTVPAWLALLKHTLERNARDGNTRTPSTTALRNHARRALGADFEHFVCGGAPLADHVADFFETVGAPVIQGYGLTETGPVVSTNTRSGFRRGSVGRPLAGTEIGISDAGEILVRGPHVAGRYRLDTGAEKIVADDKGWFHTGDLGHVDVDGFLYVTGRIKSTIVLASGKNVQPEEIEAHLQACDAITECCAIALGDGNSARGEEIGLVVVATPDFLNACEKTADDVTQTLQRRVRECLTTLAAHKRPRSVIVRDQPLPRTATGKLRRAELTEWARARTETQS
ncbi:MAG: AMP-binding protein [Gammaproteobacteria bacterium]|nr:AMP-binding protein [Gammaproteobacteria bacterium]